MTDIHLFALIPLLVLLISSMIWYGRGLVHLTGLAYAVVLAFIALTDTPIWEFLIFPLVAGCIVIFIILFWYSMARGDFL